MNHDTTTKPRTGRRWMIAAALVAAIGATGAAGASMAADGGFGHMHKRGHHGPVDAATAAKHIDKIINKVVPDATEQQKARLTEIARAAFADMMPVRAQLREAHKRAHELLMAPVVDRVALESLRAEQMARMDALSKRMLAAVTDAADILTPEQRTRFHDHMKKRMH